MWPSLELRHRTCPQRVGMPHDPGIPYLTFNLGNCEQPMSLGDELRHGDNVVFVLDRQAMTPDDLSESSDEELELIASAWLNDGTTRFFCTVGRNFQAAVGIADCHFASREEGVLFDEEEALLEAIPAIAREIGDALWVIITTEQLEDAIRDAMDPA